MRLIRPLPALLAALATLTALPETAAAADNQQELEGNGIKGAVGGGLLGAEAIMLIEAALKVKPAWAYVVGGLAGGAAGGVGGYFWETGSDSAKLGMYLLTGGIAFAIPTTVAVLSSTAYEPPADYVEDRPPADEPVAEPPQPGAPEASPPQPAPEGRAPASKRRTKRLALRQPAAPVLYPVAPPALVGVTPRQLTLSVPAVEVRDLYSKKEIAEYGVEQGTEVRVPVLSFAF